VGFLHSPANATTVMAIHRPAATPKKKKKKKKKKKMMMMMMMMMIWTNVFTPENQ
jgi:accessory gene regulator protein AgrB